jgi:hypothetical protein
MLGHDRNQLFVVAALVDPAERQGRGEFLSSRGADGGPFQDEAPQGRVEVSHQGRQQLPSAAPGQPPLVQKQWRQYRHRGGRLPRACPEGSRATPVVAISEASPASWSPWRFERPPWGRRIRDADSARTGKKHVPTSLTPVYRPAPRINEAQRHRTCSIRWRRCATHVGVLIASNGIGFAHAGWLKRNADPQCGHASSSGR